MSESLREKTRAYPIDPKKAELYEEEKRKHYYKTGVDLPPCGSVFKWKGKFYKITGWRKRAKTYKVTVYCAEMEKGPQRMCSVGMIKNSEIVSVPEGSFYSLKRKPKVYRGRRIEGEGVKVWVNGMELDRRLDLMNHSPDGFEWGYGGSGPAQLALAILADYYEDDKKALEYYQQFKDFWVSTIKDDEWKLEEKTLAKIMQSLFITLGQIEADELLRKEG